MLSHHDELELLAIIEGELDDDRLASDPDARALIVAMRRDREMLRSEPEPQMPNDLSARIEQALTRPMLIAAWGDDEPAVDPATPYARPRSAAAARPGSFRRQHHRPMRRMRLIRFAMAACIGLLLLGGLYAGINTAMNMRADHDRLLAQDTQEQTANDVATAQPVVAAPAEGSAIHHYAPHPVLEAHLAEQSPVPLQSAPQPTGDPIAVEFALVIEVSDRAAAEASLKELVAARGESAAFVAHMSRAEAMQILDERMASSRPHGAPPPRTQTPPSRPVTGSPLIAPSLSRQIDYASRGATHTVTIRLSQLPALLDEVERNTLAGGARRSALQPLPDMLAAGQKRSGDGDLWLTGRSIVREAIAELKEAGDDPLVHLPIVIE